MRKSAGTQIKVRSGQVWYCSETMTEVEVTDLNYDESRVNFNDGLWCSPKWMRTNMKLVRRVAGKPHYKLIDGEWVKQ